jgi:hypothetical protein
MYVQLITPLSYARMLKGLMMIMRQTLVSIIKLIVVIKVDMIKLKWTNITYNVH